MCIISYLHQFFFSSQIICRLNFLVMVTTLQKTTYKVLDLRKCEFNVCRKFCNTSSSVNVLTRLILF